MSQAVLDDPPMTIAAFDAFLDSQSDGYGLELVDGRIVAMNNPSTAHEQIVSNVGVRLKLLADDKGCLAFFGGMRIQRSEERAAIDKPRPDILVRCGPLPGGNFVTDPLIVIEVLSPSTIDVDRGEKLRFYKRLPTLQHIVLFYQDQMRGEHYRRADIGWSLDTLTRPDDVLDIDTVAFTMRLKDGYFGVPLSP